MKRTSSHLLLAALLATAGAWAQAQPMQGCGGMDPAAMQQCRAEFHAQRMAELKTLLQLTPQQEAAWTAFTAAMQPPAQPMRLTPAERSQLTDAQRAERWQQRQALMAQRKEAAQTFRAQLSPEQQQVFDQQIPQHRMHGGGRRGGMAR